jgi:hypothetical protein
VSAKHSFCQRQKSVSAKTEIGNQIKLQFVSHKIIPYRGPHSASDNTTTEYGLKNLTSIFTRKFH